MLVTQKITKMSQYVFRFWFLNFSFGIFIFRRYIVKSQIYGDLNVAP